MSFDERHNNINRRRSSTVGNFESTLRDLLLPHSLYECSYTISVTVLLTPGAPGAPLPEEIECGERPPNVKGSRSNLGLGCAGVA
jgi:hypothetical protein